MKMINEFDFLFKYVMIGDTSYYWKTLNFNKPFFIDVGKSSILM